MNPTQPSLSLANLYRLPADAMPAVRPDRVRPGVVHLGLGAFHRAHQAVYTEQAMAAAGGDWGIVGVAQRSRDVLDRLAAQNGLYSVVTTSAAGARARVIGALTELRHAASEAESVVARIADPGVRVVTLTVTEKAYQLDATGMLQVDDELRAQLTGRRAPTLVPALLVRGLMARVAAESGPLAVVCCDNLANNGERLHGMVTQALTVAATPVDGLRPADATLAEATLAVCGGDIAFPCTMVDRIVPATTEQTLATARANLGLVDLAPVVAEPFRQWVVQDIFPGGRPAWEQSGAIMTDDVAPWEMLKLRVLNAVHSALAYLGALAGKQTIAEALAMPGAAELLGRFVTDDVFPTLVVPPGESLGRYGRTVFDRFANPTIAHRTLQVAMDGSQKLPYRVLGTIADRRVTGAMPNTAALVLAAWMRFVRGSADDGSALPLQDPAADRLRVAIAEAPDSPSGLADALFGVDEVFGDLAEDDELRAAVVEWLTALDKHGAAGTIRAAL